MKRIACAVAVGLTAAFAAVASPMAVVAGPYVGSDLQNGLLPISAAPPVQGDPVQGEPAAGGPRPEYLVLDVPVSAKAADIDGGLAGASANAAGFDVLSATEATPDVARRLPGDALGGSPGMFRLRLDRAPVPLSGGAAVVRLPLVEAMLAN